MSSLRHLSNVSLLLDIQQHDFSKLIKVNKIFSIVVFSKHFQGFLLNLLPDLNFIYLLSVQK